MSQPAIRRTLSDLRVAFRARLLGALVRAASLVSPPVKTLPSEIRSIFVLRNNDLGDVLVATPLFAALRNRFPAARISAGIGDWSREVLLNNPHIDEVMSINAPWYNGYSHRLGLFRPLKYLLVSRELSVVRRAGYDVGIDVVGSFWGALLLTRCGIPFRMGVKGYDGGESALSTGVQYDDGEPVGRMAMGLAALLGAATPEDCRPQVFLTPEETETGNAYWRSFDSDKPGRTRIVVAHGSGAKSKRWPLDSFRELCVHLSGRQDCLITVVGSAPEATSARAIVDGCVNARSVAGDHSLRDTFSITAAADLVICNSSMMMHAAAAFSKPMIVLLGEHFVSSSQHRAQWGYASNCIVLGKEPGAADTVAGVQEVIDLMPSVLSQVHRTDDDSNRHVSDRARSE